MNGIKECYAIVALDDSPKGDGEPICFETPLTWSRYQCERKARELAERYGGTVLVRLPIMLRMEVVGVAGSLNNVIARFDAQGNEEPAEDDGQTRELVIR